MQLHESDLLGSVTVSGATSSDVPTAAAAPRPPRGSNPVARRPVAPDASTRPNTSARPVPTHLGSDRPDSVAPRFRTLGVLLLVTIGLIGPTFAQETRPAPKPSQPEKPVGDPKGAGQPDSPAGAPEEAPTKGTGPAIPNWSQPFVGLVHTYSWHLNGLGVGQTRFTVRRVTPESPQKTPEGEEPGGQNEPKADSATPEPELHIESNWDFAAPGRIHSAQGMTKVNARSLAPIYYQQAFHSVVQETPLPIRETTSIANAGILNTTVTNGDHSQATNAVIPRGAVLYGNQMVEHVVLFAALAQATTPIPDAPADADAKAAPPPSKRMMLVRPMAGDAVEGSLTYAGTEERRGVTLKKWNFEAPGVKATLWLAPDGILEEYRQGGLSVRREKAQIADKEPK